MQFLRSMVRDEVAAGAKLRMNSFKAPAPTPVGWGPSPERTEIYSKGRDLRRPAKSEPPKVGSRPGCCENLPWRVVRMVERVVPVGKLLNGMGLWGTTSDQVPLR